MARIPKGIVITTSTHTRDWLMECFLSAQSKYPIFVVGNDGFEPSTSFVYKLRPDIDRFIGNNWNAFELGGILRGKERFDEFVHIMDTTLIKDPSLFDKLFNIPGHVFLTKGGYHYMGKFVSDDLPDIPQIDNKNDAVALELRWLQRPYTCFEPDLPVHTNIFEMKHGRKNMVLENDYLIKYKATWSL